ncbi:MAG TPA: signal peptidase II [Rhabdochlamydiaceae bacterium]|nr:signal peptidase II [Rhabdochlamydiaceae bacterium]
MFKKIFSILGLGIFLFITDALLKAYIHHSLPVMSYATPIYPYGGIGVFKDWHGIEFSLTHVINKGAAWGAFASLQKYLLYFRLVIIGGLLTYLFFVKNSSYKKLALTLIVTGAIGNVIDYFVYGHVVDMFYFVLWGYSYPVFNVADAAIFCGIVMLILSSLFQKSKGKKKAGSAAKEAA